MTADVGERLAELAAKAPSDSAARPALTFTARLLGAGHIAPRGAAQGLRDLAHDIRLCGRAEGMGDERESFSSIGPTLLDEGARAIEAA